MQLIHGPSSRSPRPGVLLLPGEFLGKGTGTLLALQQTPQGPGAQGQKGEAQLPLLGLGDLQLIQRITLLESLLETHPLSDLHGRTQLSAPLSLPLGCSGSTHLPLVLLLPRVPVPRAQPEGVHPSLNSYINIILGNPSEENNISRTNYHFLCGCLSNGNQMMFIFKKMKMPIKK